MTERIRYHVPFRTGREDAYIAEALAQGTVSGNGPFTKRAHGALEALTPGARVLLTHSCTAALEMSAMLLDLEPGDEVIVPSFAFTSTAAAFLRAGATVRFAEVVPETMCLDPAHVASLVGPKTRALVPIHYGGSPADLDALRAAAPGADLIEDAAQCIGATLNGQALGTFGRFGTLSFHETKNLHCGLGGALIVNEASDTERAEYVWERGTNRQQFFRGLVDKYTWVEVGSSFYPTELQAAFLLAQLEAEAENRDARTSIAAIYDRDIAPVARRAGALTPPKVAGARGNAHIWHLVLPTAEACERLRLGLAEQGIDAYTHYVPLHASPVGARIGYRLEDLPVTCSAAERLLRLPLHTSMTTDDVARVVEAVNTLLA